MTTIEELRVELERVRAEALKWPPMHAMRRELNRQAHEIQSRLIEATREAEAAGASPGPPPSSPSADESPATDAMAPPREDNAAPP